MLGDDINRLNLYMNINGANGKAIWQKYGNIGNRWNLGHIYIENPNTNIKFVFEGIVSRLRRN